jgi:hypothetical protein
VVGQALASLPGRPIAKTLSISASTAQGYTARIRLTGVTSPLRADPSMQAPAAPGTVGYAGSLMGVRLSAFRYG